MLSSDAVWNLQSFSEESINFEKAKAILISANPAIKPIIHSLEDHSLLKGSIHNFDLETNIDKLKLFNELFAEIWANDNDSLIIRAMLTIDDFCIDAGGGKLGEKYFFGNGTRWNTILTIVSENVKRILPLFLTHYNEAKGDDSSAKLQYIVDSWLAQSTAWDWRHYFIKYKEMTSTKNNLYTWKNDFELRNLGGNSLLAYHINPYVRTVGNELEDKNVVAKSYGLYAEESPLRLGNRVELYCKENGWLIILPEKFNLSNEIISEFNIFEIERDKQYLLTESKNKDRIETAIEFCNRILS